MISPWSTDERKKRVDMKRKKMEIGQSLGHILSANRVSAKGNDDIYENTQFAK